MECKNPRRDLPIGIIGSLIVTTIMYVAFCTVMTGAVSYTELNVAAPPTVAVSAVEARTGKSFRWLNIIVSLGALFGLTSVMMIMLLGQSRVFFSIAKDGMLPSVFAKVHPKFKTPYVATIVVGTITAILAAILPVDLLGNMTSIGTLLAFFIVHAGVILLRFTRPDVERWFKIPGGKYLFAVFPILGMVVCVLLIAVAEVTTIWVSFQIRHLQVVVVLILCSSFLASIRLDGYWLDYLLFLWHSQIETSQRPHWSLCRSTRPYGSQRGIKI